ncbi:Kelch motif, partial [Rhizoctonia solani]
METSSGLISSDIDRDVSPWSAHVLEITTPEDKYLAADDASSKEELEHVAPPLPRYNHSLSGAASPVGKFYIFGGSVGDRLKNDTWSIQLSQNSGQSPDSGRDSLRTRITASLVETTGQAPSPRSGHASVFLNGRLVVWGGMIGALQWADVCLYSLDTNTNVWTKMDLQPAPSARCNHAACIHGNRLIFHGGCSAQGIHLDDMWSLDLDLLQGTPKWEEIKVARKGHSPSPRSSHAMVAYQNKLYIVSNVEHGLSYSFGGTSPACTHRDTWCFNMATRVWSEPRRDGPIPPARSRHTMALARDSIQMFGGAGDSERILGDYWCFRVNEKRWYSSRNSAFQPTARAEHSIAVIGQQVVIMGGRGNFKESTNERTLVHVLDTGLIDLLKDQSEATSPQNLDIIKPHVIPFKKLLNVPMFDGDVRPLTEPVSEVARTQSTPSETKNTKSISSLVPEDGQVLPSSNTFSKYSDSRSEQSSGRVTQDVITGAMSATEIFRHLINHSCRDITDQLDTSNVSEYAVSGGGFGDVYHAKLRDGRRVGMKCVRFQVHATEKGKKLLKHAAHELYVWSKCRHPNVLELLGVMLFRGQITMVSPWLENGHLRWFLEQNPETDRCALCIQIADGVEYLHSQSIVHGDLKPENILISKDHVPKLADFGSATLAEYTLGFTHSSTTQSMTLRWTAPEVIRGESKPTQASDIYALGMEIVTRSVPFAGVSDYAIVFTVASGKIPIRSETHIPPGTEQADHLWTMLTMCWAYSPEERLKAQEVANTVGSQHSLPSDGMTRFEDGPGYSELVGRNFVKKRAQRKQILLCQYISKF